MKTRMRPLAAVAIAASLALAACGGSDDSSDGDAETSETTEAPAEEPADDGDEPAEEPAEEPADDGDEPAEEPAEEPADDGEEAPAEEPAEEPAEASIQDGGESTIIQFTDALTLDPTIIINSPTQGSTVMSALFDNLYTVTIDGVIQPRIATDFTTDDGITWTMTLRDDVVFTDGTPFTAQAIVEQWVRAQENIRASGFSYLQGATMSAPDDTTFEIVLPEINYQFHWVVEWSGLGWIPSPTAYTELGEEFGNAPVGAGPFVLDSRTPNAETVFVRNENYWQEGLPKLDQLTVLTIPDPQQGYDTLDTGGADAYISMPEEFANRAEEAGYDVSGLAQVGGSGFLFGTSRPPFDNIKAREAVFLAMDMDMLNNVAADGTWDVPTTFIQPDSPFYNPDNTFPQADAERAQQLLDELADEGNPVSFTIATTEGEANTRAIALQTLLAGFDNLEVAVETIPGSEYGLALFTGDFDLAIYGFGGVDPEPVIASTRTTHALPIASFGSEEIDAAVQAAREATSNEERKAVYDELFALFNDAWKMRFTARNYNYVVTNDEVDGAVQYGQGTPLLDGYGLVN